MSAVDELVVTALPGDRRAAALSGGVLLRVAFAGVADALRVGDVLQGRVARVAHAIGAAFVDLGRGPAGLLMLGDAPADRKPSEGDRIIVEVVREADGEKGPKLVARRDAPASTASGAPLDVSGVAPGASQLSLLARGPDPIVALALWASARGRPRLRVDDPAELRALTSAVPELAATARLWMEPQPLFEQAGVAAAIDEALAPAIRLAGGGRLVVDEAAALTSIDVDTAAAAGGSPRATPLAVNLQAAEAIGRLIQLRELAGLIVIDFVPMRRPAERARVLHVLREALAGDDRTLRIGGWTTLGLFELSRERRGPSLLRRMTDPCGVCGGAVRTRLPVHAAGDALRRVLAEARGSAAVYPPTLTVSPAVQAALEGPLAAARAEVEQRLGMPLCIVARPELAADGYCLQDGVRAQ